MPEGGLLPRTPDQLIEQAFSRSAIGTERRGLPGGAVPRIALFGALAHLTGKLSELMVDLITRALGGERLDTQR